MEINQLISLATIDTDIEITSKAELFKRATHLFYQAGIVNNEKRYIKDLNKREKETSTGIEDNFGIPHAKSKAVNRAGLAFIKTGTIIDYEGLDGLPVQYAFVIAVPQGSSNEHLEILSNLSRKLMNDHFRKSLKSAETPDEIIEIINNV